MSDEDQGNWVERGYVPIPDAWNAISGSVIRCAIEVHRLLGPGLGEVLYEEALCYELGLAGLSFKRQHPIRLRYKEIRLPEQKIDLLVEDLLVVELKSLEAVPDVFLAQLVSYMRSTNVPLGLLINFNCVLLKKGLFRRINPHASAYHALRATSRPPLQKAPVTPTLRSSVSSDHSEFFEH